MQSGGSPHQRGHAVSSIKPDFSERGWPSTPIAVNAVTQIAAPTVATPVTSTVRPTPPWRRLIFSPDGGAGCLIGLVIVLLAVFAPWVVPQNPYDAAQLDLMNSNLAPGSVGVDGRHFWLGSDDQGRDVLSAMLYGLRISLTLGIGSALIATVIGTTIGITAAYWPRRWGAVAVRLADLQLSFPSILVALTIVGLFGKGVGNLLIALVVAEWAWYARSMRAAALIEIGRDYVVAARGLGLCASRVLFRHVFPNCLPMLTVLITMQIARAIALEATLSFLGLGMPVTRPSIGLLVANGYQFLLSGEYWISVFPGAFLVVTMIALNLIGERLRTMHDPRSQ
jgi:peptide/nickel transport system permease protein